MFCSIKTFVSVSFYQSGFSVPIIKTETISAFFPHDYRTFYFVLFKFVLVKLVQTM